MNTCRPFSPFHCLRRACFEATGKGSEDPADLEVKRVVGGGIAGDAGVRREDLELEGFVDDADDEGEFC